MRPHQWAKNVLVFVPLVAAHRFGELPLLFATLAAFVAMGLVASAGYIVNDLLDLQADRAHLRKSRRPFASGALAVPHGPVLAALLLAAGLGLAAAVSLPLALWVAFYLALSLAYSVWLKRKVLIDVFMLAGLYTHRILAGSIATAIAPSFWLLALSMFFFLGLAMLKRYSELVDLGRTSPGASPRGRGYRAEDLETLGSLGAAAGFSAVFVLALYIDSANVRALYRTPEFFWLWCPLLLYWLSRMWIGARRGVIDDDPLIFALRDRVSLVVFGAMVVLAVAAATIDLRCLLIGRC
jgi:4-hydroxybenzoate polyprenyltransferase